ncbi:MAG: hypothetical protein HY684_06340 [Chloroflexi bacterium]|nr:hypothetical protein [Chloroflexota bacterium]
MQRLRRGGLRSLLWRYLIFLAVLIAVFLLLLSAPAGWFSAVSRWMEQNVAIVLVVAVVLWLLIAVGVRQLRGRRSSHVPDR